MKDKKIIIAIILCCLIFTFLIVTMGVKIYFDKNNSNENEGVSDQDYKYVIIYNDGLIPGRNYEIYLKNDLSIKLFVQPGCSTKECMDGTYYPEKEIYNVNFSKLAKEKINSFYNELFANSNSKKIELGNDLDDYKKSVIESLILKDENKFLLNQEKYVNLLIYYMNNNEYYIYLKSDNSIFVNRNNLDTKKIESFNVEFNRENQGKVINLFNDLFKNTSLNKYVINENVLSDNDLILIKAIINNDESLINNNDSGKKQLFTIKSFNRVNCQTGILIVYSDNSYEYVGNNIIEETGTFNYKVNLIRDNLENYSPIETQPFIMEYSNGEKYKIYDNNDELKEFMHEINIELDRCI